MTDRATLQALLNRVLEGTGPDRELDAEIEACLTGRVTHPRNPGWTFEKQDAEWKLARLADSRFISRASRPAPPYTGSLDAALTRVPQGWRYDLSNGDLVEKPAARLTPDCVGPHFEGYAQTVPRALIAAWLKAMMEALGE